MTQRYFRKVIRIRAEDSPNVIAQKDVLPGLISYREYLKRRKTWDKVRQCIGLDGQFYEGAEFLLFPPEWLNRAETLATTRIAPHQSLMRWLGIDPGEGGDDTAWAVVDKFGLIHLEAFQTPNTAMIIGHTIGIMTRYGIQPENVLFDRGGGGKEHADMMVSKGFKVRAVGFGESIMLEPRRGLHQLPLRLDVRGDRQAYKNRRAQMYGEFSALLDPDALDSSGNPSPGFAIPARYSELRRQLALIPKLTNEEGIIYLPSKNKRDDKDTRKTLKEILGCSPDESDALVLATHAMLHSKPRALAATY